PGRRLRRPDHRQPHLSTGRGGCRTASVVRRLGKNVHARRTAGLSHPVVAANRRRAAMKRTGFGMCSSMAVLLWAAAAAALSPADKCEAGKLLAAGKYGFCRLKAEAKAVKTGTAPDFATCNAKYGDKWGKLEGVAAGAC